MPSATTSVRSAISMPSSIIAASLMSSSRLDISCSSAVVVRSTNISDTELLLVVRDVWLIISSPTGSPTRAHFLVETPASIRSITAHVSGSRSAKCS